MKAMCLQAMAIVYGQCYDEIGAFHDTEFIVRKLELCEERTERDRLLIFIDKLLFHKQNVKLFLDANGIKVGPWHTLTPSPYHSLTPSP